MKVSIPKLFKHIFLFEILSTKLLNSIFVGKEKYSWPKLTTSRKYSELYLCPPNINKCFSLTKSLGLIFLFFTSNNFVAFTILLKL